MDRDKAELQYKWDLSKFVKNEQDFNDALKWLEKQLLKLKSYEGKLKDAETIYKFWKDEEAFSKEETRLALYLFSKDLDNTDEQVIKLDEKLEYFAVRANKELAFVDVEILKLSDTFLKGLLKDSKFQEYDRKIQDYIRSRKLILSKKEEELLTGIGSFSDIKGSFRALTTSEIKFDSIKQDNKTYKVDESQYSKLMQSKDRFIRENTVKNLMNGYKKFNLTLSNLYINKVKQSKYFANTRKFKSSFDLALFNEEVEPIVYDNLITAVNKNFPAFYAYAEGRKKRMGLNKIAVWDFAPNIEKKSSKKYSYDDSINIIKKALSVLGKDYLSKIDQIVKSRSIDVYPNKNKRSGGYSVSDGLGNTLILLNHVDTYNCMSTIAHELGHSIHSMYSETAQPYSKGGYTIFVAEVASTVNEILLSEHTMLNSSSEADKRSIADELVKDFRSTVFRQSVFSEFERSVHGKIQNDEPVSYKTLNSLYLDLTKKYYGKKVTVPDYIQYEWSRIPHFYSPFYVYKYATGFISAILIVEKLKADPNYKNDYIRFLSAGCSDTPINLLKDIGVDLTKAETFDAAFKKFAYWSNIANGSKGK